MALNMPLKTGNGVPKILVIRFSSIGDIVLTTPVLRCLRQQLGAEVHFLTKTAFRSIVDANPHINKVYAIQKRVGEVLPELRRERYDAIIDLHTNLRSWQVRLGLWDIRSYSFNKINLDKWLMVNLKIDCLPRVHVVDRYLATVKPLGVVWDKGGLDYYIPEGQEVDLSALAEQSVLEVTFREQLAAGRYVAFVIGAAHQTKRMPTDKIASICGRINRPVVLLGGPAERVEGDQIAAAAGPHVLNACGTFNLHQSASLVRQATTVITHDTGLMHIAAALGKSIISLWGNTIPAFGMSPFYPEGENKNTTFEVKGLSCRPCSKIGFQQCPKGHFDCMRQIRDEEVARAAEADFGNTV